MNVDIISPGGEFAQEVKTALGQSNAVRSGGGCRRGERPGTAGNGPGDNDCDGHRGGMSGAIDDGRARSSDAPTDHGVVGRLPVAARAA